MQSGFQSRYLVSLVSKDVNDKGEWREVNVLRTFNNIGKCAAADAFLIPPLLTAHRRCVEFQSPVETAKDRK